MVPPNISTRDLVHTPSHGPALTTFTALLLLLCLSVPTVHTVQAQTIPSIFSNASSTSNGIPTSPTTSGPTPSATSGPTPSVASAILPSAPNPHLQTLVRSVAPPLIPDDPQREFDELDDDDDDVQPQHQRYEDDEDVHRQGQQEYENSHSQRESLNQWFTLPSDFEGNPPPLQLCRTACNKPPAVSAILRSNYALAKCVCESSSSSSSARNANVRQQISEAIASYDALASRYASFEDSTLRSLISDIVTTDHTVAFFAIEVGSLICAGYLPSAWPLAVTVSLSLAGFFYGLPIFGWGAFFSYVMRSCLMTMGADLGINQQHLYTSAISMLFVSVICLLVTNDLQVLFTSIVLLFSSLGGIAAVLESSSAEDHVTSSRGVAYILAMRFTYVTSQSYWSSIETLARSASSEYTRYVIVIAVLVACFAGGKTTGYFAIIAAFVEAKVIFSCAPIAIINAFITNGIFDQDALFTATLLTVITFKLTGYFLVRFVASGHSLPYLHERKDYKYDKNSSMVPVVYYSRFIVHTCASLVARPHKDYGVIYSSALNAVNLHYIVGRLDLFVWFTFLGWISNFVVAFLVPGMNKCPMYPPPKKTSQSKAKKAVAAIEKENLLNANTLDKTLGSDANDTIPTAAADWEFIKENGADVITKATDSHATNADIADMHWTTKAVRTSNGRAHCVISGANTTRCVSHVYADDFETLRDWNLDQFTTHIDGKKVTPTRVQYYNYDPHVKEAILILTFNAGDIPTRPTYIKTVDHAKESIAVLMFGNDGWRIDNKQIVDNPWGGHMARYRFYTQASDSGKGIFTVLRDGGVRVLAYHFAKSGPAKGNVGILAHPYTDILPLVGDAPVAEPETLHLTHLSDFVKQLGSRYESAVKSQNSVTTSLNKLIEQNQIVNDAAAAKAAANKVRNVARRRKQALKTTEMKKEEAKAEPPAEDSSE